jgi:hypothetical protein
VRPASLRVSAYLIACPLIFSGELKLPLPGTPFTSDVFWAKGDHCVGDRDRHLVEHDVVVVVECVAGVVVARVVCNAGRAAVDRRLRRRLDPLRPVNSPPAGMPLLMKAW